MDEISDGNTALTTADDTTASASPLDVGRLPGSDLPASVFVVTALAYAWMALAGWLAFASPSGPNLTTDFANVIIAVIIGLPVVAIVMARRYIRRMAPQHPEEPRGFLDVWGARLKLGEAELQVLIIPLTLALAATLFGLVKVIEIGTHFAA